MKPRPADGDLQDGYLFVYGHDYSGALHTLAQLDRTGAHAPRFVFGVWYSDYTPYSSADIEASIYPPSSPTTYRSTRCPWTPIGRRRTTGMVGSGTASSSRNRIVPEMGQWARDRRTLNIHSSIDDNDPALPRASDRRPALAASSCTNGPCKVWDWSSVAQAESNFALQQTFQSQGVSSGGWTGAATIRSCR